MKSIYIVVTLWVLTIALIAVYYTKVRELRQDLGRAVNNTEAALKNASEAYELAETYKAQRDSLQKIVNLKTEKP